MVFLILNKKLLFYLFLIWVKLPEKSSAYFRGLIVRYGRNRKNDMDIHYFNHYYFR